jgi:hypothetical protein
LATIAASGVAGWDWLAVIPIVSSMPTETASKPMFLIDIEISWLATVLAGASNHRTN